MASTGVSASVWSRLLLDIFELRKKYDAPVHMATHDGVIDYIGRFMQSTHTLITKV